MRATWHETVSILEEVEYGCEEDVRTCRPPLGCTVQWFIKVLLNEQRSVSVKPSNISEIARAKGWTVLDCGMRMRKCNAE